MVCPVSFRRSGQTRCLWIVFRSSVRCSCLLLLQAQLVAPGALARGVVRVAAALPHLARRAICGLVCEGGRFDSDVGGGGGKAVETCGHCWWMLVRVGAVAVSAMDGAGLVKFPVGFVMACVWPGHG